MYLLNYYFNDYSVEYLSDSLKELDKNLYLNINFAFVFNDHWDGDEVILVTNTDSVYCVGQNVKGCLGFGHANPIETPTRNDLLSHKNIIKFAKCSKSVYYHIALYCLTADGQIYVWGYDGKTSREGNINPPKLITGHLKKKFIDIKCGCELSVALTEDGQIFTWNSYDDVLINDSNGNEDLIRLQQYTSVIGNEKVMSIYCSAWSYYALLENGNVYGWGFNAYGQLCLGYFNQSLLEPTLIKKLKPYKIKKISCGSFHVLMLDENGQLFSWGDNRFGQLGIERPGDSNLIQQIQVNGNVVDILAINYASYYCLDNGDVNCFGETMMEEQSTVKLAFTDIMKESKKWFGTTYVWTDKDAVNWVTIKLFKPVLFDDSFSDVTLVIDDQEIKAHKIILASASKVFRAMFNSDMQERESSRVVIKDTEFKVIQSMIKFIYTKVFDTKFAVQLLFAANYYDIAELHNEAVKHCIKRLTARNAKKFAFFGEINNSNELLIAAQAFIANNQIQL